MVGFCHLTDSHHFHHRQKPTMVGICHGGNMPVGHDPHPSSSQSSPLSFPGTSSCTATTRKMKTTSALSGASVSRFWIRLSQVFVNFKKYIQDCHNFSLTLRIFVILCLQDDPEWFWVVRADAQEGFVPAGSFKIWNQFLLLFVELFVTRKRMK